MRLTVESGIGRVTEAEITVSHSERMKVCPCCGNSVPISYDEGEALERASAKEFHSFLTGSSVGSEFYTTLRELFRNY